MRVGVGYDVHAFVRGRKLVLGGVHIPFPKGLDGHSDADVLTHAIIDALLGAACLGDIGSHFPSSDPQYKGCSSMMLLRRANSLLLVHGWEVQNIDATVIAEHPRLGEFVPDMRRAISGTLEISAECVSVKNTTSKGLGFLGAGKGIAVHAVALLEKRAESGTPRVAAKHEAQIVSTSSMARKQLSDTDLNVREFAQRWKGPRKTR
jgi:2-C-methyl-D-erythritol 2,4-cyclodiphosphate synthase